LLVLLAGIAIYYKISVIIRQSREGLRYFFYKRFYEGLGTYILGGVLFLLVLLYSLLELNLVTYYIGLKLLNKVIAVFLIEVREDFNL
jgi:hypothetical protein